MAVNTKDFFNYIDDYFSYRQSIYEVSRQTVKSNRVDLNLFKHFIGSQHQKTVSGPAGIDSQFYLKNQRHCLSPKKAIVWPSAPWRIILKKSCFTLP